MFSLHFPSSQAQLNWSIPDSSFSSTTNKQCRGMGKWQLWSVHSSSFLLLLAPWTFPLLLHHDLAPRLQGNFCSSNWNMFSPTFFVAVDIFMAVSYMYFSCLSHSCCAAFLSFLKFVATGALPTSQMGSILCISGLILESTETDCSTWGPLPIFFHRGHAWSLSFSCHVNQIQLFWQINHPEIYFEKLEVWIWIDLVFWTKPWVSMIKVWSLKMEKRQVTTDCETKKWKDHYEKIMERIYENYEKSWKDMRL